MRRWISIGLIVIAAGVLIVAAKITLNILGAQLDASRPGTWSYCYSNECPIHGTDLAFVGDTLLDYDGNAKRESFSFWNAERGGWKVMFPTSMPTLYSRGIAVMSEGRVLVVAGESAAFQGVKTVLIYDIENDSWTEVAPVSGNHWWHRVVPLGDDRFVVIDETPGNVEMYDAKTDTWTPTTIPHEDGVATILPNENVVFAGGGGRRHGRPSAEVYQFDGTNWEALGPLNTARMSHALVALPDGRLFVYGGSGGHDNDQPFGTYEIWDPNTGEWTSRKGPRQPVSNAATALLSDGRILVSGGDVKWSRVNDLRGRGPAGAVDSWIYDPSTDEWTRVSDAPFAFEGSVAKEIDGRAVFAGQHQVTFFDFD